MREGLNLSRKVTSSAIWQVLRAGSDNIFRFVTFAVLARVLSPADFGVFAIATLFVAISRTIANAGLSDVLVRETELDDELKNTLFWTNLSLNVLLGLTLLLISPVISYALDDASIVHVLAALSLTMLVGPFNFIAVATAVREFKHKELATIGFITSAVGSSAAVSTALLGWGLWALVAQSFAGVIVSLILLNLRFPWRPGFQFSWPRLRAVLPFSLNILTAQLLQTLIVRLQEFLAATHLTMSDVGLYRIGSRFYELICATFVGPVSSLAQPALSKIRTDLPRLSHAYLRMVAVTSLFYCPVMLGFVAVAYDAIPFLFGEKWLPSIPIVASLALLGPATILAYFHSPALSCVGRSDVLRKITILQFTGTLVFGFVGVQFGIIGLAVAFVVRSYATLPIQMHWLEQATGLRPRLALAAATKPFLAAAFMAGMVLALQPLLHRQLDDPIARLLISSCVGTLLYAAIMLSVFRRFTLKYISEAARLLREFKSATA